MPSALSPPWQPCSLQPVDMRPCTSLALLLGLLALACSCQGNALSGKPHSACSCPGAFVCAWHALLSSRAACPRGCNLLDCTAILNKKNSIINEWTLPCRVCLPHTHPSPAPGRRQHRDLDRRGHRRRPGRRRHAGRRRCDCKGLATGQKHGSSSQEWSLCCHTQLCVGI